MNTAERRGEILKILHNADAPVAARELAGKFGVSRQVIVQDLAVIRLLCQEYCQQQKDMCSNRTAVAVENLKFVTARIRQPKN